MKFKNVFLLLFAISIFTMSCESETKPPPATNPSGTGTVTEKPKEAPNWTCVPGKQVGLITPTSTEGDIIFSYGKENVVRGEMGLGEGFMEEGTILFPNTDNELFVLWKEGQKFKQIQSIKIMKEGTQWKTSEGITVGTSLEDLVKINGKDFKFAGFEWDFAGVVLDWDGGSIDKNLKMYLEPSNEEAIFPDLLGEETFSTSLPKAKEARLKVASFEIVF